MSRSPGLGFFLFILLNATMFVRPQELFPASVNYRFTMRSCWPVWLSRYWLYAIN